MMDVFVARVYAGGGAKDIDPDIINATAIELKKGLKKGYKKDFKDLDVDSPDFEMLANLENNVYQFATAKNYQDMRLLTDALTNEAGELLSFTEFRDVAETQFLKFNEDWLESEYSTAISGSMNAARWTDYTKNAKAMPFLRYSTAGDSLVRDSHAALDGTVKRIDDGFWENYYPPNGWRCRCTTSQTGGSTETPDGAIVYPEVQPMFRTNLAKQGLMFPKNHPYYKDVPPEVLRKSMAYLPPENTYRTVKVDGELIDIHPLHGAAETNKNLKAIANYKKHNKKAKIKLMPVLNPREEHLASRFYPAERKAGKFPDTTVNGKIWEIEVSSTGSATSIKAAIRHGKKQATRVLVSVPEGTNFKQVHRHAKGQLVNPKSTGGVKLVEIFNSKEIIRLNEKGDLL